MRNGTTLRFLFMALASFCLWSEGELDVEALKFEHVKKMDVITTTSEEQKYFALCEAIAAQDCALDEDFGDYAFDDDSNYENTQIEPAAEQPEIDPTEAYVAQKIRDFIKKSPTYARDLKKAIGAYVDRCEKSRAEVTAADAAIVVARYFREQGDVEKARRFYRLSMRSVRSQDDYVFLELGDTFLDYVNRVIDETGPTAPTAEIFSALLEAIRYNSYDQGGAEPFSLGDAKNNALIKHRDRMVRWPISAKAVLNDSYYGRRVLAKRLFDTGLVERLLGDKEFIEGLWKLKNFNASMSKENIFRFLKLHGFESLPGSYVGAPQYIFVNKKGYLVRIKRNARTMHWEFTLGISLLNPIIWDSLGNAQRTKLGADIVSDGSNFTYDAQQHSRLCDVQHNEVAKIIVHDGLIQIIPPGLSNAHPWLINQPRQMLMDSAHRPVNPVGTYVPRTRRYDYRALDNGCFWK